MKVEGKAEVEGAEGSPAAFDEMAKRFAAATIVEEEGGEGLAMIGGAAKDAVGDGAAGAELEAEEATEAEREGGGGGAVAGPLAGAQLQPAEVAAAAPQPRQATVGRADSGQGQSLQRQRRMNRVTLILYIISSSRMVT